MNPVYVPQTFRSQTYQVSSQPLLEASVRSHRTVRTYVRSARSAAHLATVGPAFRCTVAATVGHPKTSKLILGTSKGGERTRAFEYPISVPQVFRVLSLWLLNLFLGMGGKKMLMIGSLPFCTTAIICSRPGRCRLLANT